MSAPRSAARAVIILAIVILVAMIAGSLADSHVTFALPGDLGEAISMFAEGVVGVAFGLLIATAVVLGLVLLAVLGVVGVGLLLMFVLAVVVLAVLGALAPLAVPVALIVLVVWAVCRDKRRPAPVSADLPSNPT